MIDQYSLELVLTLGMLGHVVTGILAHCSFKLFSEVDTTRHAVVKGVLTPVQQTRASSSAFLLPLLIEYLLLGGF